MPVTKLYLENNRLVFIYYIAGTNTLDIEVIFANYNITMRIVLVAMVTDSDTFEIHNDFRVSLNKLSNLIIRYGEHQQILHIRSNFKSPMLVIESQEI